MSSLTNAHLPAAEFELLDYIADFLESVYIKVRSPYRVGNHLKKRTTDESHRNININSISKEFREGRPGSIYHINNVVSTKIDEGRREPLTITVHFCTMSQAQRASL